jgi:hypothetical protein
LNNSRENGEYGRRRAGTMSIGKLSIVYLVERTSTIAVLSFITAIKKTSAIAFVSKNKGRNTMERYMIVLGHYHYYSQWHGGQWSKEYARLCKIGKYFKPSRSEEYFDILEEEEYIDARMVYDNLVAKHQVK